MSSKQNKMTSRKKKVEEEAKRLVDEVEAKRLVDMEEAKRLAEETEAQRKAEELLKQHQSLKLSKTPSTPSTPNLGIFNITPQAYTPINVILGDSSFFSQDLNFEGTIVAIEDYYYYDRTKSIEKRSHKRKRGESTKSRSFVGRVVEWKVGLDPEENVVQEAFALLDFAGLNASSILEVTSALSTSKTRITEVETKIKNVKDELTSKFKKKNESGWYSQHRKLNKSLQTQRDEMNVGFERRM